MGRRRERRVLRLYARRWRRDDRNTAFGALRRTGARSQLYCQGKGCRGAGAVPGFGIRPNHPDNPAGHATGGSCPLGGRRHGEFRDGRVGSRSRCGILCIYGRWRRGADRYGSVGSRDRAGIRYAGYRACESRFRTGAVPRFRIRRADGHRRHGTESLYAFGCRDRDEQHFRIRISQKQDANLLLWLCPEVRLRQIRFDGGIYRVGAPQTQRFGPDCGR